MTKRLRARHGDRGAVAIVVAIAMIMLMAAAAVGVDLSRLVYERQQLQNALDAAAAAGAQQLPGHAAQAISDAEKFARVNTSAAGLGSITPKVALRCVVPFLSSTGQPDWVTASSLCGVTSHSYNALTCNTKYCSLDCTASQSCNTIIVKADKTVDYMFGRAINFPTGNTGTIVSAACRGFCGSVVPNPMNVVVMSDRTYSMSDSYSEAGSFNKMKTGILGMLGTMTQTQQFVAFGAIHKSETSGSCPTATETSDSAPFVQTGSHYEYDRWGRRTLVYDYANVFKGTWVPVPFQNDYTTGSADAGTLTYKTNSAIANAVNCMTIPNNGIGTHLASAMKGAARYLLGKDPNNLATLDASGARAALGRPIRKVIIFETDGRPEEIFTNQGSSVLGLDNTDDIGAGSDGEQGCRNLQAVATNAKNAGITIITIGYGNAAKYTCAKYNSSYNAPLYNSGSMYVRDVLASVASNEAGTTTASKADHDCSTTSGAQAENTDGDYFFCASNGSDLASVFRTAMGSISGAGKLMSLPGVETMTFN